jgi:hypothetical protein
MTEKKTLSDIVEVQEHDVHNKPLKSNQLYLISTIFISVIYSGVRKQHAKEQEKKYNSK